jgi:hypothetical protein
MTPSSTPEGLPAPSGRHRMGRASYDWVDAQRAEICSSDPQDRRELVVWVWYPAAPAPDAERAAYLPEPWAPTGQFLGLDATGLRLSGESPAKAMLAATQIESRRMWRITCDLLLTFFATHVRREGIPSLLAGPSGDYPELSFGPP